MEKIHIDNYTRVPNLILDDPTLGPYEFRILLHIIRQTIGYGKKSDGISLSQFVKATGMSKKQVQRSLKRLKEKRLIHIISQRKKSGAIHYNRYSPTLKFEDSPIVSQTTPYGLTDHSPMVSQTTTKENLTKEERETSVDVFRALTAHEYQRTIERYLDDVSNEVNVMNPSAYKAKIRREISKRNENTQNALKDWYLKNEVRRLQATTGKGAQIYSYRETRGYQENEDFDPDDTKIFYAKIEDELGNGEIIGADTADELLQMIQEKKP